LAKRMCRRALRTVCHHSRRLYASQLYTYCRQGSGLFLWGVACHIIDMIYWPHEHQRESRRAAEGAPAVCEGNGRPGGADPGDLSDPPHRLCPPPVRLPSGQAPRPHLRRGGHIGETATPALCPARSSGGRARRHPAVPSPSGIAGSHHGHQSEADARREIAWKATRETFWRA
jgi:hypothetical protein